jgi:hypothetical protein
VARRVLEAIELKLEEVPGAGEPDGTTSQHGDLG